MDLKLFCWNSKYQVAMVVEVLVEDSWVEGRIIQVMDSSTNENSCSFEQAEK